MWPIFIKNEEEQLRSENKTTDRVLWLLDAAISFGLFSFYYYGPDWAIFLDVIMVSVYVALRVLTHKITNILKYHERRYLIDLVKEIDLIDQEKQWERERKNIEVLNDK
jgi:hypothetical protein